MPAAAQSMPKATTSAQTQYSPHQAPSSAMTPRKVVLQTRLEAVEAALAQALQEKTRQEEELRQLETPSFMRCPITMERLRSPVTVVDGHTFERAAIERWLARRATNPLTGAALTSSELHPSLALRDAVRAWEREHGREPPPPASPHAAAAAAASPIASSSDADAESDGEQRDGYLTGDSEFDIAHSNDPFVLATARGDEASGAEPRSASVLLRQLDDERAGSGLEELSPQSTFSWAWREYNFGSEASADPDARYTTQRDAERQREAEQRRREGPTAYDARVATEAEEREATLARQQAEAERRRLREAAERRRHTAAQLEQGQEAMRQGQEAVRQAQIALERATENVQRQAREEQRARLERTRLAQEEATERTRLAEQAAAERRAQYQAEREQREAQLEAQREQRESDRRAQISRLSTRELKIQLTALGVDFAGAIEKRELEALLFERTPFPVPAVPDCATQ